MTATTSAPVINGITGRDIYNDTVCAYAWGLSNREQYNTNATFNAVLANCIGNLLQADGENFWAAYCNNPPDDGCPYGYCPNSDVAGPITRISAYFTSFATACLLEIASDKNELVWSQLITIWSILVSTCISIAHGRQLGRVHAELALLIVGSPLTCSMWTRTVVSLRHFRRHKWGAVSITRQFLLICAFVTYIVFAVLSRLPNTGRLFSQESCYQKDINVFAPFFLLTDVGLYTCSIALAIVSLLSIVEWNRRKVAWLEKRGNWYLRWSNVKEFRRRMCEKYQRTKFFALVCIPFVGWVWTTELIAVTSGGMYVGSVFTFGSLLTLFATLPPIFAIIQAAAANQAARRWERTEVSYEKAHNPSFSGSTIDLSELEKHGNEREREGEGEDFGQWCRDLWRSVVVGWVWLFISGITVGLAVAAVVVGYWLAEQR